MFTIFENLDTIGWIGQILGLIGFALIGISYQFKKEKYLIIAIISFLFFIGEASCAKLWSNVIASSLTLIRNLVMLYLLKYKNKELSNKMLGVYLLTLWIAIIIYMGITNTFNDINNYLPILAITVSTIMTNFKNEYIIKTGLLIHEGLYLVLYIVFFLPFSLLRQAILVLSCIVGMIRIGLNNKNKDTIKTN